jgi:hypothetical protein
MSHAYFDNSARGNDLHRRSLRGGAMAMISQGGNVTTQVISTIVLAPDPAAGGFRARGCQVLRR